jgi:hypothetical protein
MPIIPGQLDHQGRAVVAAQVSVPAPRAQALQAARLQVSGPLALRGQIDPGASISCVDHAIFQSLSLTPCGQLTIVTPSSGPNPPRTRLYRVGLTVLHLTGNPTFHLRLACVVAQANLAPLGIDLLIGRDVLALCRFVYDGRAGTFSLEY